MKTYYNEFFEKGQQKIQFNLLQIGLPSDDPVYTLIKVMEDLNYTSLLAQYSTKGRKGYNPIMMFAVLLYAGMRGVKAVDRIVELCERDIAFIWLTKGLRPQRDAFYDFMKHKLNNQILEDLHYQFIRRVQKEGYLTLGALYIDGTKIKANANRYTFVWRGSINYHLVNLLDTIDTLYTRYNTLLLVHGYNHKYNLGNVQMFVLEGMDRVKEVIEKNLQRKLTKHKKLPNNTLIEIDHCSPLELLQLQINLTKIAHGEGIVFTTGRGKRKPELQQLYEEIQTCGERLLKYKECYEILGTDRNSYSKTDVTATFMRMKDDHMMNGQLKPAYNVQIAVENYFIIHSYISNDRTDYDTLIPVLEKHETAFGHYPDEVTAVDDTHYYQCHDGRRLLPIRTETSKQKGYTKTVEVYGCDDCSGCEHKAKCLYKYNEEHDTDKNKVMKVNEVWVDLSAETHENIESERGILNRQIRSIQTEGHFGDIKENENFRRFNYRSSKKVKKEFLLYVIGRNMNKYHRFKNGMIQKFEGKMSEDIA